LSTTTTHPVDAHDNSNIANEVDHAMPDCPLPSGEWKDSELVPMVEAKLWFRWATRLDPWQDVGSGVVMGDEREKFQ
jgi:hypothetical protein